MLEACAPLEKRQQAARPDRPLPSGQRGRSPVCPQNRAYGSVHGSSRKAYPPIDAKPMRELPFGASSLSYHGDEPVVGVSLVHPTGVRGCPTTTVGVRRRCRLWAWHTTPDQFTKEIALAFLCVIILIDHPVLAPGAQPGFERGPEPIAGSVRGALQDRSGESNSAAQRKSGHGLRCLWLIRSRCRALHDAIPGLLGVGTMCPGDPRRGPSLIRWPMRSA